MFANENILINRIIFKARAVSHKRIIKLHAIIWKKAKRGCKLIINSKMLIISLQNNVNKKLTQYDLRGELMLEVLFRSRVVIKLITYFMQDTDRECYLREVSREIDEPASAVQRELQKLEEFGLIVTRKKGNHRYYAIKQECPILPDLKGLFLKSEGIVDHLKESFSGFKGIQLAFVYGDFAEKPSLVAEIKIMIIGQPNEESLEKFINTIRATLKRKIGYVVYEPEQFGRMLERQDSALSAALGGEKIILVANVADRAAV
jgi:DNA-binding transcriptional ArsR family regulator